MVFGNNTASDTSKLSKIPQAAKRQVVFGKFWNITSRYYFQYINTTYRSCYYLFIIEAEKFSVTHKRPFFSWLKKTNTGVYVRNIFLRHWKKWLTDFCETSTNHSRQTTWNSSMKVIYKSQLLRSLEQWYNKATLLYHWFLLLYHYYLEIVILQPIKSPKFLGLWVITG